MLLNTIIPLSVVDPTTMNSQLKPLNQWAIDSGMKMNNSKSTVMWFKPSKRSQRHYPPIVVDGIASIECCDNSEMPRASVWSKFILGPTCFPHLQKNFLLFICYSLSSQCSRFQAVTKTFNWLNYCLAVWGTSVCMYSFITETKEDAVLL